MQISYKKLIFQFVEKVLFHLLHFLSGLFVLSGPFSLFFIVNVPFSILSLVECFLEQVLYSSLQNCHDILVFILNDLVFVFFILIIAIFLVLIGFGFDFASLLFDLKDFLRRFKDTIFDLLDLAKELPVGHAILPGICAGIDFASSQQHI